MNHQTINVPPEALVFVPHDASSRLLFLHADGVGSPDPETTLQIEQVSHLGYSLAFSLRCLCALLFKPHFDGSTVQRFQTALFVVSPASSWLPCYRTHHVTRM